MLWEDSQSSLAICPPNFPVTLLVGFLEGCLWQGVLVGEGQGVVVGRGWPLSDIAVNYCRNQVLEILPKL